MRRPRRFPWWLWWVTALVAITSLVPLVPPTAGQSVRTSIQPLPGPTEGDDRFGIANMYPEAHWQMLARNAGMRWNRWEFRWASIEPRAGRFDWEGPDYIVDYNQRAGMKVQGILISLPTWAEGRTADGGLVPRGLYEPWDSPRNLWGQWVRTMAERYRGRVQAWEVWNEPDYPRGSFGFWFASKADYYQLLKVAYRNIRAVDPHATVLMAGLMYWGDPYYLEDVLAIAKADPEGPAHSYFFDAVAWHIYSRPTDAYHRVLRSRQLLHETVGHKAIWINEGNLPVWPESRLNNYGRFPLSGTLEEQAAWVLQWYAYALAAGADRVILYRMHDSDEPEAWGLARSDGSLRPAYVAYQLAARHFANTTQVTRAPLGEAEHIVFQRPGRRVTALWNTTPRPIEVEVGAAAAQAERIAVDGSAVTVTPQNGAYRLALPPATANTGLHPGDYLLGGAPYLLVEEWPANLVRVEESDPGLRWGGTWRRDSHPASSGGAKMVTAEPGASLNFAFEGSALTWYTSRGPWAGQASLSLDGRPLAEIDLYNSSPMPEAAYTFTNLGDGPHLLTLTAAGARAPHALGNEVVVDAFVAQASAVAPSVQPQPSAAPAPVLVTVTPLPSSTPTATPTAGPGTPTVAPPTPTSAPTTPTPSPTMTAAPTATPTAAPTATLPPTPIPGGYSVQPGVPPVFIVPAQPTEVVPTLVPVPINTPGRTNR